MKRYYFPRQFWTLPGVLVSMVLLFAIATFAQTPSIEGAYKLISLKYNLSGPTHSVPVAVEDGRIQLKFAERRDLFPDRSITILEGSKIIVNAEGRFVEVLKKEELGFKENNLTKAESKKSDVIRLVCTKSDSAAVHFTVDTVNIVVILDDKDQKMRNVKIDDTNYSFIWDSPRGEYLFVISRSSGRMSIRVPEGRVMTGYQCQRAKPRL